MFENSAELQELLESNNEGERGVKSLCMIARELGYKDTQYFGQLGHKCSIGDMIEMLEDSPGLIEAMKQWIQDNTEELNEDEEENANELEEV